MQVKGLCSFKKGNKRTYVGFYYNSLILILKSGMGFINVIFITMTLYIIFQQIPIVFLKKLIKFIFFDIKLDKYIFRYIINLGCLEVKIMKNTKDILKDTPDYEEYTANEAKLSIEELRELGYIKCGGCCSSGKGCSGKKGCCKRK